MLQEQLLKVLPRFDVVSFDVFDTLLLRPYVKPTDLFAKIGGEEFMQERIAGERKARQIAAAAGRCEVMFDEIYALLPRWGEMKQRELDEERRCLTANPEIVEVWNEAARLGKKRVITSDMYLPRSFIEDVLREKGIDGWDGFYLSSDTMKSKGDGSAYELLKSEWDGKHILHIGDNYDTDFVQAKRCCIEGYHYKKIADRLFEDCPYLKHFVETASQIERRMLVGALMVGWHFYKLEHPDFGYWNKIGFIFGGILGCAYMQYVDKLVRRYGLKHLLFVARDGYALERIYNLFNPKISTTYFYAPRSMRKPANAEVERQYANYVVAQNITDNTALVDATTINFTAQSIVEKYTGKKLGSSCVSVGLFWLRRAA